MMTENISISIPSSFSITASVDSLPSISIGSEIGSRPPEAPPANNPPTYEVEDLVEDYTEINLVSGTELFLLTVSDPDGGGAQLIMSGYDTDSFQITKPSVYSYLFSTIINVSAGSYSFEGNVVDEHGATVSFRKDITVTSE